MSTHLPGEWNQTNTLSPKQYGCGYCGTLVSSNIGYYTKNSHSGNDWARIFVCPGCNRPSFFEGPHGQVPGSPIGNPVDNLPEDIERLYTEARIAATYGAPTASVMTSRKLIMNIAVNRGASTGLSFAEYVDFLESKGFMPPDGKGWVDSIRQKGNDANHEIPSMTPNDAEELVDFTEMLLKFIYEFPARVRKGQISPSPSTAVSR